MRRPAKDVQVRRWASAVLAAAVLAVPVAESTPSSIEKVWLHHSTTDDAVVSERVEKSSENVPVPVQPTKAEVARRNSVRSLERTPVGSSLQGLTRDLLDQRGMSPGPTTRLDFCSEFTKPDSLKIRLMGTPKNHRSPPA